VAVDCCRRVAVVVGRANRDRRSGVALMIAGQKLQGKTVDFGVILNDGMA
jgi:hypothetical protein